MIDLKAFSESLTLAENGIWYAPQTESISYPEEGNSNCFELENDSFWFQHRNQCIISLVDQYFGLKQGPFFDIGGGNGYVSLGLSQKGYDVVLVEPGSHGAHNARQRGVKDIINASIYDAHFYPNSLPAIGLFDVVEHIEADSQFLRNMSELLKAGGKMFITVPAYQFLWSYEDEFAGHFRRYTLQQISQLCRQAGLEIRYASYFFNFLPLPIFLLRSIPSKLKLRKHKADKKPLRNEKKDHHQAGLGKALLDKALKYELEQIRQQKRLRFGGSCLLALEKPSNT